MTDLELILRRNKHNAIILDEEGNKFIFGKVEKTKEKKKKCRK